MPESKLVLSIHELYPLCIFAGKVPASASNQLRVLCLLSSWKDQIWSWLWHGSDTPCRSSWAAVNSIELLPADHIQATTYRRIAKYPASYSRNWMSSYCRERDISPGKNSGAQLGIEPKISWMLVRRSYHWATGARGRGAEDISSIGLSRIQLILSLWAEIPCGQAYSVDVCRPSCIRGEVTLRYLNCLTIVQDGVIDEQGWRRESWSRFPWEQ